MAKRSVTPQPEPTPGIFSLLRQSGIGTLVVVCGLLGGTGWYLWQQVQRTTLDRGDYQLDLNDIELSSKPAWIRADVRAEALRDASLDPPLSLVDQTLAERLQKAYAMHPWISDVQGVQLTYPAHAEIKVTYRRPIAMVELTNGLLPIDATGVLLPPRDFEHHPDVLKYPRLVVDVGSPLAPAGTTWNDPIVVGGALIAVALEPIWSAGRFQRIRWIEDLANIGSITRHYAIETSGGGMLIWGQAPGREHVGELAAADKVAALQRWIDSPAGLAGAVKQGTLDLRSSKDWPQ